MFRTSVGLEGSESTLGDAATTFIQTLEAAGLGNYVVGRGGNETRLQVAEGFGRLVEKITEDNESEQQSSEVKSEPQTQSVEEEFSNPTKEIDSPLQIRLELSGEEDPNEIEKLIVGIRRGLGRNLGLSDSEGGQVNGNAENSEDHQNDSEELESFTESDSSSGSTSSDHSLDSFVDSSSTSEDEQ